MNRTTLFPFPIPKRDEVAHLWARLMKGLDPPEAHYGPEYAIARPRPQDRYFVAYDGPDDGAVNLVGLTYEQEPSPTTRVFALGLFAEYRGQGIGPRLQAACIEKAFRMPEVIKVETEVYASNLHSLRALHGRYGRMIEEGRQRATIVVGDRPVDRVLFGITRDEWQSP